MPWAPQKLSAIKFYSFWHFSHISLVWEAKKQIDLCWGTWRKLNQKLNIFEKIFLTCCPCARAQGHSKSWVPSNLILSDTFPIFSWCGKLKKQIGLCWGTWFFRGLILTRLVKNHIFEVKIRPNEGRQPGHTRPQQVGWWSSWSDLDLEFDLEIPTVRNP